MASKYNMEVPFLYKTGGKYLPSGDYSYGPWTSLENAWTTFTGSATGATTILPRGFKFAYYNGDSIKEVQLKKAMPTSGYSPSDLEDSGGGSIPGVETTTTNSGELAIGKYNISYAHTDDIPGSLFTIGIGSSTTDRKNAFEIDDEGNLYLIGIGSYNGANRTANYVSSLNEVLTYKAEQTSIAPAWTPTTYTEGSLVMKDGVLYKAIVETTSSLWDEDEWQATNAVSCAGTTYTAGEGIKITDATISTDSATQTEVDDNVTFDDTTLNDVTTKIINILGLKTMVTKIKTYVTAQIAEVKKLIINEKVPITAVNPSITLKNYTSNSYFECDNDIESLTLDLTDISAEIEYTIHFTTSATATSPLPLSITKPYKVVGDPAEFECESGEEYELSIRNGICALSNINTVTS